MPYRDDDRQGLDPREFPDPDETDLARMSCPHCRAVIFDESEQCPACGRYLSEEDGRRRHPWWVVLGLVISLGLALYWVWPVP